MDKNQRNCIQYLFSARPNPLFQAVYSIQHKFFVLVDHATFESVIMAAIFMNAVVMLMQYKGQSDEYTHNLELANLAFLLIFIAEAVLKLIAFNPTFYFGDVWNAFDFVIVVGSIVDITEGFGVSIGFLRLFRVARILKLVNKGDAMQQLLSTFVRSFQSLPYVLGLLSLVFFIFAVIGMFAFGKIPPEQGTPIDIDNNFRDFSNSVMVLIRCTTGEAWQDILAYCYGHEEGGWYAIPYFVLFMILVGLLVVNLFIAVIIDNFDYLTRDWSELGVHHLTHFQQHWQQLDPAASGKINPGTLVFLFRQAEPPLGFGKACVDRTSWLNLMKMNPAITKNGMVTYHSTMLSLIRLRLQIKINTANGWDNENAELCTSLRKIWPNESRRKDPDTGLSLIDLVMPPPNDNRTTSTTAGYLYASLWLQSRWRMMNDKKTKELASLRAANDALARPAGTIQLFRSQSLHQLYDESETDPDPVRAAVGQWDHSPELSAYNSLQDDLRPNEIVGSSARLPDRPQSFFNSIEHPFSAVLLADGMTPTMPFLQAVTDVVPFFDLLGARAFAPVKKDILGNVKKLTAKLEANVPQNSTLQAMIRAEIEAGTTTAKNSATDALRWLKRALNMMRQLLQNMADGERDVKAATNDAYAATLKNYHNFLVRGVFAVAMSAVPKWEGFVKVRQPLPCLDLWLFCDVVPFRCVPI